MKKLQLTNKLEAIRSVDMEEVGIHRYNIQLFSEYGMYAEYECNSFEEYLETLAIIKEEHSSLESGNAEYNYEFKEDDYFGTVTDTYYVTGVELSTVSVADDDYFDMF